MHDPNPPDRTKASLLDWVAVLSSGLGAFMAVMDIQITNGSLVNIEGGLGTDTSEGSWISTAYLTAEIITIPLSSWVTRMMGQKRFLMIYTALFILFSMGCGWATSLQSMIVFRMLQGFFGGVQIPAAFTVARQRLPPAQQPTGIMLFGVIVTIAPTLGPTLGGWLTDHFDWRYLFFINLVPGAIGLFGLNLSWTSTKGQWSLLRNGDWLGIALMAVGLASLVIMLENGQRWDWFSADSIRLLACLAVIGIVGCVARELTAAHPFINLRVLRNRTIGAASLMMLLVGGVLFGSTYVLTLYCSEVQQYSPMQIGQIVMYLGIAQLIMFPAIPWLMRRIDARLLIVAGLGMVLVSCWINMHLTADVGALQLIIPQMMRGFGLPLFSGPLNQIIASSASQGGLHDISALTAMMRNLGGSFFISAAGTMLDQREHFHFSVIAERVTRNSLQVQQQVQTLTGMAGGNQQGALQLLSQIVRKQATIMAFSDAFAMIGVALVICLMMVPILRRPPPI